MSEDVRQQSRARWTVTAKGWGARADQMRRATMPVSSWMIDAVGPQPGDTLLELAAGPGDTGFLAAELIRPGGTLICSDFVPEMLTVAQERAQAHGLDNVRFKQIDAETGIDIEAASIDGALCRWGYMLMADPVTALQETRRVLKPGGRLALAAWTGPDENLWSALPARELIRRGLEERPEPGAPGQFAWAEELSVRNVRFKQIDAATSIDVEAGSIDGVLCRWGYMLMADPENALRETRRVLRPGGRLALAAWAGPDENPWSALPARELVSRGLLEPPDPDGPGQFAWARPGLIAEYLDAAGFTEHHVEALGFPMVYRSPVDWWTSITSFSNRMATAVAQADDDTVDAIGEAIDRHAEAFRQPDGTLRIPACSWVAWAAA